MATSGEAEGSVLRGFVTERVERLEGSGPAGPLDVYLGAPWASGVSGGATLRPFLAVAAGDRDGLVDPRGYVLRGSTAGGGSTEITP